MADRSQVPSELSAQTASPPEQLDAQDPVASLQAAFPSMDRTSGRRRNRSQDADLFILPSLQSLAKYSLDMVATRTMPRSPC